MEGLSINSGQIGRISVLPVISVVMPAYNAGLTVRSAILSVISQGYSQFEIIVCDDSSTDDTECAIRSIEPKSLRLVRNSVNIGAGRSRDRAIENSSAPWVAFIDADDAWHPDRLQQLIKVAGDNIADVIFDDTMLCHDTPNGLVPWRPLHGTNAFGGCGLFPRAVDIEKYIESDRLLIHPMIRRSLIVEHGIKHSERRFAEDAEFYLRLAHAGAKFWYVPKPYYLYRISPGSLTAQAKDPTLMRKCLEECAQWPGWSEAVLDAFQIKTSALHENESLYELRQLLRTGDILSLMCLVTSKPGLLRLLPRRLLYQLSYQTHRVLHGGRGR